MKVSFMTWICPEWTLTEVLTGAVRYGYDGVEPRAEGNQKHGVELATTKKQRKEIASAFADCGVEMSCIATSIKYSSADADERAEMVERTKKFVDLAADVGCPYLRVFGGKLPDEVEKEDVKKYVAESLRECGEHAAASEVQVLLETHDDFRKAQDAVDTVRMADHASVQILWDIAHPFHAGDTIQEAFDLVKPHVRHLHVHDYLTEEGEREAAFIGEGNVPHEEAVRLLKTIDFKGHLSGEWIKFGPAETVLPRDLGTLRGYIAGG
jgi:sugar phosphate isomerase/epimerase